MRRIGKVQRIVRLEFQSLELCFTESIVITDTRPNALARLGGYLNRATDPPPVIIVMWRGVYELRKLRKGYGIALGENVGN